jgi:flagellar biosynthesis/type III secretory pathway protein FliH
MSGYNEGYDEGYRAGMQKMREVGKSRIDELEANLATASGVLDAVERAVRKGSAPSHIEEAYEEYLRS